MNAGTTDVKYNDSINFVKGGDGAIAMIDRLEVPELTQAHLLKIFMSASRRLRSSF